MSLIVLHQQLDIMSHTLCYDISAGLVNLKFTNIQNGDVSKFYFDENAIDWAQLRLQNGEIILSKPEDPERPFDIVIKRGLNNVEYMFINPTSGTSQLFNVEMTKITCFGKT